MGILEDVKTNLKGRIDTIQRTRATGLRKDGILKTRILGEGDGAIAKRIQKIKSRGKAVVEAPAEEAKKAVAPVAPASTPGRTRFRGK